MTMRRLLRVGLAILLAVAVLASVMVVAFLRALKASHPDTLENLFPDPRERQGIFFGELHNRTLAFAASHNGALPADLTTLANSFPSSDRVMARLGVDLWGTPIIYKRIGTVFILQSAGPDRAWHTGDDIAETARAGDKPR